LLYRNFWKVDTSHEPPYDGTVEGYRKCLIDGELKNGKETCLCLWKPGKDNSVPVGDIVFFTIDMKYEQEFEYMTIRHRVDNKTIALRVWAVTLYGSNDGINYEPIIPSTPVPNVQDANALDAKIELGKKVKYRHVKMTYDLWNTTASGQMQIAEFNLGINK